MSGCRVSYRRTSSHAFSLDKAARFSHSSYIRTNPRGVIGYAIVLDAVLLVLCESLCYESVERPVMLGKVYWRTQSVRVDRKDMV